MPAHPEIPQKNSHQWAVALALAKNANDSFLKHCYALNLDDLTHLQFVKAISKLRDRGWPIEDTGTGSGDTDQHGYRIDKERWKLIKSRVNAELGL